jgi:hypothetical protein
MLRTTRRLALFAAFALGGASLAAGCSSSGDPGGFGHQGPGGTAPGGGGFPTGPGNGMPGNGGMPGNDAGTPPGPGTDSGGPNPQTDSGTPTTDSSPPPVDSGPPPPVDSGPNDGFDQFQHHNLDVVNMYRATLGVAPLVLDQQLCTFALAGSQELSMDHMPHQHFINASNNGTIWSSGFNGSAAENQGDPNGWPVASSDPVQNEMSQIDQIQQAMFNEGPGAGEAHGHYTNMMNAQYTRLGVGLLEDPSGMLYLTNDFSP